MEDSHVKFSYDRGMVATFEPCSVVNTGYWRQVSGREQMVKSLVCATAVFPTVIEYVEVAVSVEIPEDVDHAKMPEPLQDIEFGIDVPTAYLGRFVVTERHGLTIWKFAFR